MAGFKRRRKLINPRFQLKLVLIFLGVGLAGVLLQSVLMSRALAQLAGQIPSRELELLSQVPAMVRVNLLWSSLLLVPLFLLVGITVTFRIAGPIFAIERHLRRVAAGEEAGRCRIRKDDEFHSLCDAVNLALDSESKAGESTEPTTPSAEVEESAALEDAA